MNTFIWILLVLIALLAVTIAYSTWSFKSSYEKKVVAGLKQTNAQPDSILTEADLQTLPVPVQKYLRYTGAVNQPKVKNFKLEFTGQLHKDLKSDYMPFTSEQYNFMGTSTRLFFLNATMKHLPVAGFHCFKNGDAFMDIRLFSLIKVQYMTGKEMGQSETVTFFNDMCCMAPATLIDPRIKWLEVKDNSVRASFTNNGITISAWLYFNEKGALINFISDDRYAAGENNTTRLVRWSTPLKEYRTINGRVLAGYAETIYDYPDGPFAYGTFRLTNVAYNCKN
jgi:hypothetical protein